MYSLNYFGIKSFKPVNCFFIIIYNSDARMFLPIRLQLNLLNANSKYEADSVFLFSNFLYKKNKQNMCSMKSLLVLLL